MAARTERREPKYVAIAADLEAKIRSGRYRPGQALPSQRDLSASYEVTLMTMRQALRVLADQGLVAQEPGRGTFVTPPKAVYGMGPLRSLSDELRAQGHRVDTVVLGRSRRGLPAWVARRMSVEAKAPALRVERVRQLNGVAAIHQVSWVPEAFAAPLAVADLTVTSLYGALAEHGVVVRRARERVSPGLLDARIGALLHRPAGEPVFLSDRLTVDADGAAVVFDRATILGHLIEITAERSATSVSLQWGDSSQLRSGQAASG